MSPSVDPDTLLRRLESLADTPLYSVVDGAGAPADISSPAGLTRRPLVSGRLDAALDAACPALLSLDQPAEAARAFLGTVWGTGRVIVLTTAVAPEVLLGHLRGMLFAQHPAGQRVHFRFYDPRVLRVYLPSCTPAELGAVFGPITRLMIEDKHGGIVSYRFAQGALVTDTAVLAT